MTKPQHQVSQKNPRALSSLNFFTKLWSPGTSDAAKLGFSYVYAEDGTPLAEYASGGSHSTGSAQYIYLPTAYAMHSDNMKTRALVLSLMGAGLILTVVARLYLLPIDRNQRATATLQSVTDIAEAIETFKSDFGQFPRDLDQLKSASRPYVLGAATLSDAWGQPLVYRIEARKGFVLYSKGGNGIDENGQGDDISPVRN